MKTIILTVALLLMPIISSAKYIIIIASVVLLSGCGAKSFSASGGSQQQYYKDNSECMAMSQTTAKGFGLGSVISANMDQNQIYEQCMMGKGYRPDK